MQAAFKILKKEVWLLLILLAAFLLRLKGLDTQSLWLDELHTMNEADPAISWGEMFHYLKTSDQHPPLYFIIERFSFSIFGHTAYAARFISVIAGTASIWAMYRLGKEMLNRSLGIICALLTTVNFYDLSYSQEARGYIFAFLFAALSFEFFIKLVKSPTNKTAVGYAVFTLLLLYSHYFSLFVVAAQALLAVLFIVQEKNAARKLLFRCFLISGAIIAIGYAPWLPFLKAMSNIKSFWIQNVSPASLQNFFYDYFGNAALLNPLLLLLLFSFFARVSFNTEHNTEKQLTKNPLLLCFIIILVWVFIVFLIPYLRSVLVVPMLYPRYTIVIVPAILLALSYSIELFKNNVVKYSLVTLFVVLSLVHLFFVKDYYNEVSKTQFREMTQYLVKENAANYPVINERSSWQQEYYLKKMGSKAIVFTGKKESLIDSILKKSSSQYDLKAFWIVGAHNDNLPDTNATKALDTAYTLIKDRKFYDAWARLYMSKHYTDSNYTIIRYNDFKAGEGEVLEQYKQLVIWGAPVHSKPYALKKGRYTITITAMGTAAAKEFPHVNFFCNGVNITNFYVTATMDDHSFEFVNNTEGEVVFTIGMDNDFFIPGKEDRNIILESITLNFLQ